MVLQSKGEYTAAAEHYEAVLAERTATLGAMHLDTLRTQCNMGLVTLLRGCHSEALPMCQAAAEVCTPTHFVCSPAAHSAAGRAYGSYWARSIQIRYQLISITHWRSPSLVGLLELRCKRVVQTHLRRLIGGVAGGATAPRLPFRPCGGPGRWPC